MTNGEARRASDPREPGPGAHRGEEGRPEGGSAHEEGGDRSSELVTRVLAPNPSPMTLEATKLD